MTETAAGGGDPQRRCGPALKKARQTVVKHYLPISFAVAIVFALAWPDPGESVLHVVVLGDVKIVQEVFMGIVFFISGWMMDTQELEKARGEWRSVSWGFLSILLLTPCLGFAMRDIPLEPKEFAYGLVIFTIVPTTLGVGVALVRSCKGNEAIALLLTVLSNMLGVATMPVFLKLIFLHYKFEVEGVRLKINLTETLAKLTVTIFVPTVVGKVLREAWPAAGRIARHWRVELGLLSTTCLAFVVWQALSGARDQLFSSKGTMIAAVMALASGIHLFYLAFNWLVVRILLHVPPVEAVAVIIISSQKSAPVGVTVVSYITTAGAQQGLMSIPLIVGQLLQIFLGAALVPAISKRVEAWLELHKSVGDEEAAAGPQAGSLQLAGEAVQDELQAVTNQEAQEKGQLGLVLKGGEDKFVAEGSAQAGATVDAAQDGTVALCLLQSR